MAHRVGGGGEVERVMIFASLLRTAYENRYDSPLTNKPNPHIALTGNKKVSFIDVYLSHKTL